MQLLPYQSYHGHFEARLINVVPSLVSFTYMLCVLQYMIRLRYTHMFSYTILFYSFEFIYLKMYYRQNYSNAHVIHHHEVAPAFRAMQCAATNELYGCLTMIH
jgi:hypothetical protein